MGAKASTATAVSPALAALKHHELGSGRIGGLLKAGAKAVIIEGDERIQSLWSTLMEQAQAFCRMPWETNLFDLALNHETGNPSSGDMIRFVPGEFGYVARKVIIYPGSDGRTLHSAPSRFQGQGADWTPSQEALQLAWDLASSIFESVLPENARRPSYGVALELLKYPASLEQFEAIYGCLVDSGGPWTKVGQQVDSYKYQAAGPFDRRGIRDLFGWGSLVPGLRPILHGMNRVFGRFSDKKHTGDSRAIIGGPHVDRLKAVTALSSDRDVITTQIYAGDEWIDLPLTRDSLAIFPSLRLSRDLGLEPTVHRVLIENRPKKAPTRSNLTLVLAIVEHPADTG